MHSRDHKKILFSITPYLYTHTPFTFAIFGAGIPGKKESSGELALQSLRFPSIYQLSVENIKGDDSIAGTMVSARRRAFETFNFYVLWFGVTMTLILGEKSKPSGQEPNKV